MDYKTQGESLAGVRLGDIDPTGMYLLATKNVDFEEKVRNARIRRFVAALNIRRAREFSDYDVTHTLTDTSNTERLGESVDHFCDTEKEIYDSLKALYEASAFPILNPQEDNKYLKQLTTYQSGGARTFNSQDLPG